MLLIFPEASTVWSHLQRLTSPLNKSRDKLNADIAKIYNTVGV